MFFPNLNPSGVDDDGESVYSKSDLADYASKTGLIDHLKCHPIHHTDALHIPTWPWKLQEPTTPHGDT